MSKKRRILVVEDEIPLAMMMTALLTRAGYAVEAACTAEKAMRLAGSCPFDLITLDVNLPDANGFEIYTSLKQLPHLKDTPVVFVAGCATLDNRQRALEIGAVDFIAKPFEVQDFLSRLVCPIEKATRERIEKIDEGKEISIQPYSGGLVA